MKEAIGGTWIFGLVIFFIAFFTAFISVSLNYSKCYKIKDEIIASIQRANGVNYQSLNEINMYMKGVGYRSNGKCTKDDEVSFCMSGFLVTDTYDESIPEYSSNHLDDANYCISKILTANVVGHPESSYYYVKVFFKFDLPVIRQIFGLNIEGETGVVYTPYDQISVLKHCGGN